MKPGIRSARAVGFPGAVQGTIVWATYSIIECWFITIIPLIVQWHSTPTRYHWGFSLILFFVYTLAGMIIGGILGSVSHAWLKKSHRFAQLDFVPLLSVLAILSITIFFFINLIIRTELSLSATGLAALILMIMIVLLLSVRSRSWHEKLGFLMKPAIVSAMVLGESWILLDLLGAHSSRLVKVVVPSLYLVGVVLVAFMLDKHSKMANVPDSNVSDAQPLRRRIVILTAALFVTLALSAWTNRPYAPIYSPINNLPPKTTLPNIILIVMDTVRADHLSIYGYERDTTPNLAALAKEATLYRRAVSSSDATLSTHASLFTGMYPRRHGAHMKPPEFPNGRPLSLNFETLAEALSKAGYSTLAVVSNHVYLRPEFGLAQGFQYYDFRQAVRFLEQGRVCYLRSLVYKIFQGLSPRVAYEKAYKKAEEINAQVFNLLGRSLKTDRPFFLFINYMDAHIPYLPPHPFDTLYPGKINSFANKDESAVIRDVMKLRRKIAEREKRHLTSQYDGAIAYIDSQIRLLMERLKSLALYNNSLIIITSDHGEAFDEKDFVDHGYSVYQNHVHVPLVIKYPGVVREKEDDRLVSSVDIMPTILDILGLGIPDGVQGQSLVSRTGQEGRGVLAESFPLPVFRQWNSRFQRVQRALFCGSMKLIKSTNGEVELYNLAEDPNEETNLYRNGGETRQLEGMLDQWLRETEEAPDPKVDKGTLERLESLGYVDKDKKSNSP
jgi:arylsulfatase A-like enzyme